MELELLQNLMRYLEAIERIVFFGLFFGVTSYLMAGYLMYIKFKERKAKNESV